MRQQGQEKVFLISTCMGKCMNAADGVHRQVQRYLMCFRSALWVRYSSWSKHREPRARLQAADPCTAVNNIHGWAAVRWIATRLGFVLTQPCTMYIAGQCKRELLRVQGTCSKFDNTSQHDLQPALSYGKPKIPNPNPSAPVCHLGHLERPGVGLPHVCDNVGMPFLPLRGNTPHLPCAGCHCIPNMQHTSNKI